MAYCDRCERYFSSEFALWQHERDSSFHWVCRGCDKDYTAWDRLKQHYIRSRRHDYCQYCDEHFDDDDELIEHYDDAHYYCYSCSSVFMSDDGLHEHNRKKHWYCESCRRTFQNENNLNAHLNSSLHKPKNVFCPGANCGKAFVSMSALMLHFEAGTCPSGMTRKELNRLVTRADRNNMITNPARLIKGPDGYAPAVTTETWATRRSWNPDLEAYECFLCHNTFTTLGGLNKHLQSPRHQERIYRCPNRTTCGVEYSALSALTQHVESGKCGVRKFKAVQSALDSVISGMRTISF